MTNFMKKNMHPLIILASLLLIVLTFFLVYQRNTLAAMDVDAECDQLERKYKNLQNLKFECDSMEQSVKERKEEIKQYISTFPCEITQEAAIDTLFYMETKNDIKITSIVPGVLTTFYQNGKINAVAEEQTNETQVGVKPELESQEEELPLSQMVGDKMTYTLTFEGSYENVMKTLKWIMNNDQHLACGPLTIAFDSKSGKLSGSIAVNFFSMWGSGTPYVAPDIDDVALGNDNIFGAFK